MIKIIHCVRARHDLNHLHTMNDLSDLKIIKFSFASKMQTFQ